MSSEYTLDVEDVDEAREDDARGTRGGDGEALFFSIRPSSTTGDALRSFRRAAGSVGGGGRGIWDVDATGILLFSSLVG